MPQRYRTDVLTPRQLIFIAEYLPEPHAATGRPAYSNLQLLPGILKVLRSGCRWRDLDYPGYPSGVTHWRRLRYWKKGKRIKKLWDRVLDVLVMGKRINHSVLSIDGTLIPSFEFRERTGYSGKHRLMGVKVSMVVDRNGIPLAVSLAPGNTHDGALGYLSVANVYRPPPILRPIARAVWDGPSTLLGDRGFDSLRFREFARERGYIPNIPTRRCIPDEQQANNLYACDPGLLAKRFVVERTNSWLKSVRRLRFRVDRAAATFDAFVYLAVIVICIRKAIRS